VDLAFYIRNLLYNHEVVIIPGFGAFLTKYKPAEINSSEKIVTPPSKYLAFNCALTQTDGILANYITTNKKISNPEAELYIEREVSLLNKKLDSEETILLDGIGYLSKKDGVIRFEREQDANFYTDTFGLSKVEFRNVEVKLTSPKDFEAPVRKKSHAWIYMLIILFIFIGGITYVYFYYPGLAKKALGIFQHPVVQNKVVPEKDSLKNEKDTSSLQKFYDSATNKKNALAIKQLKPNNAKMVAPGTKFYIIAGSFNTFERAAKFSKQQNKQGNKSEVIQFNQNTFRVSLGEFEDKEQGLEELGKIRAIKGNESAWLLSKIDE
jgi:hypothetical protein